MYRIAIYFDAGDHKEAEEMAHQFADTAEGLFGTPDTGSSDLPWLMTLKEENLPDDADSFVCDLVKGDDVQAVIVPQPKVSDN